ncbi:ubiquitin-like protein [Trypanosoma grayi]|uniref:ubiquitin-like protein n=1 Tax=Trypanosoma grayi TaxID=71804 RepID=UPI0004F468B5|nr:ubiquitin-like protein [Trypanosoma grayi]KEG10365.1 ubiquitin-like protein [Trypanosoma grayi]
MRINVSGARPEHTINGLEVNLDDGVDGLRRIIAERFHAAPEQLRLIHMGRLIDGSAPLSSFLSEGATVHVVVSQPAPPPGARPPDNSGGNNSNDNNMPRPGGFPLREFFGSLANIISGVEDAAGGALPNHAPGLEPFARVMLLPTGGMEIGRERGGNFAPHQTQQQQNQTQEQQNQTQEEQNQPQQEPSQQTFHRFVFSTNGMVPEAPPPTTLHIHVHVSLDELEQLPEHLERFRGRMRSPGWNVYTQVGRGPLPQAAPPSAQPNATAATAEAGNGRGGDNNATEASGGEGAADDAARSTGGFAGSSRPGPNGGEDAAPRGLVELFIACFRGEPPEAILRLLFQEQPAIAAARQRITETVEAWQRELQAGSPLTPEEVRRRAVEREAGEMIQAMQSNPEVTRIVEQTGRLGVDFFAEMRRLLTNTLEEFLRAVLNPATGADQEQWAGGVRAVFVRAAGIATDRAPVWFAQGVEGLVNVALVAIRVVMQRFGAGGIHEMFTPFLRNMVPHALRAFLAEYTAQHRLDSDAAFFQENTAPTAREETDEEDDLLDDCLAEFCAKDGPTVSAAGPAPDELRDAVHAFGRIPESGAEDIGRRAQRFRYEKPPEETGESSTMWKHISKK